MILDKIDGFNVFTDASVTTNTIHTHGQNISYYVSSSGAAIYSDNFNVIDSMVNLFHNYTNNQAEAKAIQYGLSLGYRYARPDQVINIFSDSKISVSGLRDWCFSWFERFNRTNPPDGLLVSSDGRTPVANQTQFLDIIDMIITTDRPVRFYHIRGHMKINNFGDRVKFQRSFVRENCIYGKLSESFISYCIRGNDIIDNLTRSYLDPDLIQRTVPKYIKEYYSAPQYKEQVFNRAEYIRSLDINKYACLIGKESSYV